LIARSRTCRCRARCLNRCRCTWRATADDDHSDDDDDDDHSDDDDDHDDDGGGGGGDVPANCAADASFVAVHRACRIHI